MEVENLDQVREAVEAGSGHRDAGQHVPRRRWRRPSGSSIGRALTEASGGITLENVREVAATGVDRISVGALTHSVTGIDLSLELLDMG